MLNCNDFLGIRRNTSKNSSLDLLKPHFSQVCECETALLESVKQCSEVVVMVGRGGSVGNDVVAQVFSHRGDTAVSVI